MNGEGIEIDGEAVADLQAAFRCSILTADSHDYVKVHVLWNGMYHDKRPALIARCPGIANVIAAVNFARENNLLVAVRGGGHNVAGSASCDGGIMIDLSMITGVHVDPESNTA